MTTFSEKFGLPLATTVLGTALALTACGGDDAPADGDETESGDGDGDPTTTGDGDGDPTTTGDGDGDPTTTGDGDGDPTTGDGDGDGDEKPNLGDTPNVLCEAATFNLAMIVEEIAGGAPDPAVIEGAYVDTGLQEFVQTAGAVLGRVEDGVLIDDAAISASIAAGEPTDLIDAQWRIYFVMQQYIRHEISDVAATLPDPLNDPALLYARWDDAYCYWNEALRPLGQAADAIALPGDSIEADIDAGFQRGHDGIEGEQPWAIDAWEVGPAKQIVEKTTYALAHRLVMQWSADAAAEADADTAEAYAHAAYGAFQLIEDRIATKNTPAIATIEAALLDDPSMIDAEQILIDMNIAFAKRTRKYNDWALPDNDGVMGTPEGATGANEGATYSKLIEPFMLELDGFDQAAYRQTWADWITAIVNDDLAAGEAASAVLVDWNCQFQTSLGIAECTSSIDEQ